MISSLLIILLGAGLWYLSEYHKKRKELLENTPTTPICHLSEGFREVKGRIVFLDLLKSPVSRRDCVYYRVELKEKQTKTYYSSGRSRSRTEWVTIFHETRALPFCLRDATGLVLVDPENASIELASDKQLSSGMFNSPSPDMESFFKARGIESTSFFGFNRSMSLTESYLVPGDALFIHGQAEILRDTAIFQNRGENLNPPEFVIKRAGGPEFLITDSSEEKLISRYFWNMVMYRALGVFCILLGLYLILFLRGFSLF